MMSRFKTIEKEIPSQSYVLLLLLIEYGPNTSENEQSLEMTKQLFDPPGPVTGEEITWRVYT